MTKNFKISIPTYMRNAFLIRCLDSLVRSYSAAQNLGDENISIHVLDNNPDDSLRHLLSGYRKTLPNFKYIHNGRNLGPDVNIMKCYSSNEDGFIHALGDDDVVMPNYFDEVLCMIRYAFQNDDIGVLYLNTFAIQTETFIPPVMFKERLFTLYSYEKFLEKYNIKLTFISSIILRLNSQPIEDLMMLGTGLGQLCLVLNNKYKYKNALVSGKYVIAAQRNNAFSIIDDKLILLEDRTPALNDLNLFYIKNYFDVYSNFKIEISSTHKSLFFRNFILWEIYKRRLVFSNSYNINELGEYFSSLYSCRIFVKIKNRKAMHCYAFLVSVVSRIFAGDLIKMFYLSLNIFNDKVKNY